LLESSVVPAYLVRSLVLFVAPLTCVSSAIGQQLPDAPSTVQAASWQVSQTSSRDADSNLAIRVIHRGLKDQVEIYRAPFSHGALPWDMGVSAVTASLIATDRRASEALSQAHRNVSLHISNVGLYGTMGSVGAFYVSGLVTHNAHARETGLLSAEAIANSAVLYGVLQFASGRERPLEGDGHGRFWQNNALGSSFPSGHAIATWSGASVIAHEYPRTWVQIVAYGTAGAVSITRFSGSQHFPADVFVGSVLGYLVGQHIFHSHCDTGRSTGCGAKAEMR
jgi:PAP2 superfamily